MTTESHLGDEPRPVDPSPFQVSVRSLPPEGRQDPTAFSCTNQPNGGPLVPGRPETRARQTRAMADSAKLWPNGKELLVFFLNGTDPWGQVIRSRTEQIAREWSDYANISFIFTTQPTAHITVNLQNIPGVPIGTYRSYIGTDCVAVIARGTPSMDLVFSPELQNDPRREMEFSRVILHEFGHALGFVHEHMRPDRDLVWNVQELRRRFGPVGFSDEDIRQQIMNFYERPHDLRGGSFDLRSIMMYEFEAGLATFEDGTPFQTPNNVVLSPQDKVVASMLYPRTDVEPTPEELLLPGDPPRSDAIRVPGQVARYRFQPRAAGTFVVETRGSTPLLLALLKQRRNPDPGRREAPSGQMLVVDRPSLAFRPADPGEQYYVEVRHARPMVGTGDFSIAVRQI